MQAHTYTPFTKSLGRSHSCVSATHIRERLAASQKSPVVSSPIQSSITPKICGHLMPLALCMCLSEQYKSAMLLSFYNINHFDTHSSAMFLWVNIVPLRLIPVESWYLIPLGQLVKGSWFFQAMWFLLKVPSFWFESYKNDT